MSVINRIQVVNFLNTNGEAPGLPWRPRFRDVVFNLKGQSTAIQAFNGTGKTALANAVFGLLSVDKTLRRDMRTRMAPAQFGIRSHIRVEFLLPEIGSDQADWLAKTGDQVPGETWVFGVTGYRNEGHHRSSLGSLHYYYYHGRLEDTPLTAKRDDGGIEIFANSHFERARKALTSCRWNVPNDDWLTALDQHVSRANIQRNIAFQKQGGGDKGADLYAFKQRKGEAYDAAFFYEIIAPEILAGAMDIEGEPDEYAFDDTLQRCFDPLIKARHSRERAEANLAERQAVLGRVNAALELGQEWHQKHRQYQERLHRVAGDVAVVNSLMAEGACRGVPRAELPGDALARRIAAHAVWVPGETAPRLADAGLEALLGRDPRHINELAKRNRVQGEKFPQVIEIPCHNSLQNGMPGPQPSTYTLPQAGKLIELAAHSEHGLPRGVTLDRANEAINAVERWLIEQADTNPHRLRLRTIEAHVEELNEAIAGAERERETLQARERELQQQQHATDEAEAQYQRLVASQRFTEAELAAPAETAHAVTAEAADAVQARQDLEARRAHLASDRDAWERVRADHDNPDPHALDRQLNDEVARLRGERERIEQEQTECDNAEAAARQAVEDQRQRIQALTREAERLQALHEPVARFRALFGETDPHGLAERVERGRDELRAGVNAAARQAESAQREIEAFEALKDDVDYYAQVFGEESSQGLEERVRADWRGHQQAQRDAETEARDWAEEASALAAFRQDTGEEPHAWLARIEAEREATAARRAVADEKLADRRRQRQRLETDPVAPDAEAERAAELLDQAGITWKPLHATIERENLPEARRRAALTVFSGLLFAPVVSADLEAAAAARVLSNEAVLYPVFRADRLSAHVREAAFETLDAERTVGSWLAGVATLAVDCLIDPSYIEHARAELDRAIATLEAEVQTLAGQLAVTAHDSPQRLAAERAARAVTADAETLATTARERLAALEAEAPALCRRVAPEAIAAIRSRQAFDNRGGADAWQAAERTRDTAHQERTRLEAQQPAVEARASADALTAIDAMARYQDAGGAEREQALAGELHSEREAYAHQRQLADDCRERRAALTEERRQCQATLDEAYPGALKIRLDAAIRFVDAGGPQFFEQLEDERARLDTRRRRAERRAEYKLTLGNAQPYIEACQQQSQDGETVADQLADVHGRLTQVDQQRQRDDAERAELTSQAERQRQAMRRLDNLAVEVLKRYRDLAQYRDDVAEVTVESHTPEQAQVHERAAALLGCFAGEGEPDPEAAGASAEALADALASIGTHAHDRGLKELKRDRNHAAETFDKAVNELTAQGGLHEVEREILIEDSRAKRLAAVERIASALDERCAENQEVLDKSRASEDERLDNAKVRMTQFILRGRDNLHLLKRVAGEPRGERGAHLVVDAAVIGQDQADSLFDRILVDMEDERRRFEHRLERGVDTHHDELAEAQREGIREKIYRGIFQNATVKYVNGRIRQDGRAHRLTDKLSGGEKASLGLMWAVRLADFAIHREARRRTVTPSGRRKAVRESEHLLLVDGLFSTLSDSELKEVALAGLEETRGRFQLIGFIHAPEYINDFNAFPVFIMARRFGVDGWIALDERTREPIAPPDPGSVGVAMVSVTRRAGDS